MSSLKDLASLIMVPSLVKDGRLDTVKPLGNSIIHPDATGNNDGTDGSTPAEGNFTFSRGSNLAATRVDVNGLIEKGRENLLLQSNQFDTTWTNGSSSETSGHTGYDGSNNAWKVTKTNAAGYIRQALSSSGVQTFSVYVKAADSNYVALYIASGTSASVWFNLTNGTTDSVNNAITSSIESVGNGWYRCSLTANLSLTDVRIYPAEAGSGVSATSGSLYIQNAQLESSMVATDYIETGASTAQAGILEDLPRLDYSGGASCPALLLEPQRINLVTHSEYLANYPINRGSISSNTATSPEGIQNTSSLVPTTDNGDHTIQSTNSLSATTYTISCFAKNNGNDIALTLAYNSSNWTGCIFDLVNGEAKTPQNRGSQSVCTADIEPYGDGWYRCSITATLWTAYAGWFTFVSLVNDVDGSLSTSWGRQSFIGVPSETAYLYGLQIEEGSYSTSYIPTMGSAVTRSGEKCNVDNVSGEIGQTQGTIFLDADLYKKTNTEFYIAISDGSLSNSIYLHQSSQSMLVNKRIAGATEFLQVTSANWSSGRNKCAITYTATEMKIYINGVLKDTESISGLPSGLSKLTLGSRQDNLGELASDANYKQALVFPTALTDSECIALTTL